MNLPVEMVNWLALKERIALKTYMLNHGLDIGLFGNISGPCFNSLCIRHNLLQQAGGSVESRLRYIRKKYVSTFAKEEYSSLETNSPAGC